MADYKPDSHFFVDHSNLANSVAANLAADAYGPVSSALTNKYRTTSFVRASALTKVFAVCDGQIMIQPQTGDPTKVNLILKPTASAIYDPIKIKYFIYRGVNKEDLIGNNVLVDVNTSDPNQPIFLQKLWKQFVDFNMPFYDQGIIDTPPETFPAFLIGYDENQSGDTLIEHYFKRNNDGGNLIFYQIPACKKGEFLGNFTGRIGLDIVLDHGDYELTNQDELFKLNLDFARKAEHIFDITTIPTSTPTKVKRFKEYIHQFIDAAAFWGSHIECGKIRTISAPNGITSATDIFTNILSKYQTKYKIYVHVQGERLRTYNYFDATRRIYGFATAGQLNETSGWPIVIQELTLSAPTTTFKELKNIELEYSINSTIHPQDRQIIVDVISPNNNTSIYPKIQRPGNPTGTIPPVLTGRTEHININFSVNGTKSCAGFLFLYGNLKQEFPLKDYFNELWTVNFTTSLSLPSNSDNLVHWLNYDRNNTVNLDDVIQCGASVQSKVIFDNGLNSSPIGPNPPTKKRRTYLIGIKNNTDQNSNYNTTSFTAAFEKQIPDSDNYFSKLYNDNQFIIYKGKFVDNLTSAVITSLTLFHDNDYTKKYSFLHLGITEEEFNKLIYDSPTVPPVVPPNIDPPQILPRDAENIFFYLEEVIGFSTPNVRKFRLGLQYEDNTGLVQILYPSIVNTVHVYTMDGNLFCSSEYADYQAFYEDFPKCKVEFRIAQPYAGEFGFDWMRIGDTLAPGDVNYKNHVGKIYKDAAHTIVEDDINEDGKLNNGNYKPNKFFNTVPKLFNRLELEYNPFPLQFETNNNIYKYYTPILTVFPPYVAPTSPTPDLDRQPIFTSHNDDLNRVANLKLEIKVEVEPIKIEFDYDTTAFNIASQTTPLTIPKSVGTHSLDITVKCLKEIDIEKLIKIRAFYNTSGKGMIIGILRIKPNKKSLRKSKKVVLITVRTNINGTVNVPSANDKATYLMKFLRQLLITPVINDIELDMSVAPINAVFNANYVQLDSVSHIPPQNVVISEDSGNPSLTPLHDFLVAQNAPGTTTPISTLYSGYFILFFFQEDGGYIDSSGYNGLNGYSIGDYIVGFASANNSTATHEFLHSANLPHSFTAYEADKYAKYTYEPWETDNILDYSHKASPPINRVSVWDWQATIAKETSDLEP